MVNRNGVRGCVVMSIIAGAVLGCGAEVQEASEESDIGVEREPVVKGTSLSASEVQSVGLAAIFHFDPPTNTWFPRPCSGKIIRSVSGVSKVITARHCVTTTGAIGGTILSASQLRVSPTASPGIANPNPPASAITASAVVGAPVDTTIPEEQRDQAIITVDADWSAQAASKDALWVADPSLLVGLNVTGYGYGINVADWNCGTNLSTVGAGVARQGSPFKVVSGTRTKTYGKYAITNSNASGQALICGDSGGPDLATLFGTSPPVRHYTGTHSTGTSAQASSPVPSFWLQQQLGGGYMSAYLSSLNVGLEGLKTLKALPASDLTNRGFAYHADLKQLRRVVSSSVCVAFGVRDDGSIGAITESCGTGGSNENWEITQDQRLISIGADRQCLTLASNNRLDLKPCLDARDGNVWNQRWRFHPQP